MVMQNTAPGYYAFDYCNLINKYVTCFICKPLSVICNFNAFRHAFSAHVYLLFYEPDTVLRTQLQLLRNINLIMQIKMLT